MTEFDQLLAWLSRILPFVSNTFYEFAQPWRLYQLVAIVAIFGVAHLAARAVAPKLAARVNGPEGASRAYRRAAALVINWTRELIFLAMIWAVVVFMREITWPSRSYLLALAGSLVFAWVVIGLMSRMIRNPTARAAATWFGWGVATLHISGFLDEATAALDGAALSIGETRISLLLVLKVAVAGAALLTAASMASRGLERRIDRSMDMSPSMKVLASKATRLLLYGLAAVVGVQMAGFDLTSLTVLSGAIGLGIGFGLQKVVSNLVSGVILVLDKSIKPGDVISLGETFGWITTLGARYVSVVTRDGREYLIPNEDLITGQVVNWSHSNDLVRLDIYFGVSYDSDPHAVRKLAAEAAANVERVVSPPAPVCHIVGFGDSSVDFILRFWIRDPSKGLTNVRGAVYLALWDALKAADVEIPFPQMDVSLKRAPAKAAAPD